MKRCFLLAALSFAVVSGEFDRESDSDDEVLEENFVPLTNDAPRDMNIKTDAVSPKDLRAAYEILMPEMFWDNVFKIDFMAPANAREHYKQVRLDAQKESNGIRQWAAETLLKVFVPAAL